MLLALGVHFISIVCFLAALLLYSLILSNLGSLGINNKEKRIHKNFCNKWNGCFHFLSILQLLIQMDLWGTRWGHLRWKLHYHIKLSFQINLHKHERHTFFYRNGSGYDKRIFSVLLAPVYFRSNLKDSSYWLVRPIICAFSH